MSIKNKIILNTVVLLLAVLCLFGLMFYKPNKKIKLDSNVCEDIVRDAYAPEDSNYLNERKDYYIENGLVTPEASDNLFKEESNTYNRSVDISNVDFSYKGNNSYGNDLYKIDFTLRSDGVSTPCELVLFVNSDGIIYKSNFGVKQ